MNIEEVDVAASLQRAGPYLGHVHLVDSNRQVPGRGHANMRSVLRALRDVGYQGHLSVEALPLPNPYSATEAAIQTIRKLMMELRIPTEKEGSAGSDG
jgi:sugar phosphate isomerase/epimerase